MDPAGRQALIDHMQVGALAEVLCIPALHSQRMQLWRCNAVLRSWQLQFEVKWHLAAMLHSRDRSSCCAQAYDMPDAWEDFMRMGKEAGFTRVQQAHLGKRLYGNLVVFSC